MCLSGWLSIFCIACGYACAQKKVQYIVYQKIDTHYLPLDLNNIYIIYLYYIYIIEKKTGKPVGCVYKRFTIYCTFLGALPDMFLRL